MESPQKRPNEKRPRECLQTACTAVSSSIAVNQNAIESVQPDVEWTSFADVKQVSYFPIMRQAYEVLPIWGQGSEVVPISKYCTNRKKNTNHL